VTSLEFTRENECRVQPFPCAGSRWKEDDRTFDIKSTLSITVGTVDFVILCI